MPRRPSPKVAALVKSLSDPSQDLESRVAAVMAEAAGSHSDGAGGRLSDTSSVETAAGTRRKSKLRAWSVPTTPNHSDGDSTPRPSEPAQETAADQTSDALPRVEASAELGAAGSATHPDSSPSDAQQEQQQRSPQQPAKPGRSRRRLSGGITRSPPGPSRFAAEAQRPAWAHPDVVVPQLVKAEPAGVAGALSEAAQAAVDAGTVGQRVEQGSNGWNALNDLWREGLRGGTVV